MRIAIINQHISGGATTAALDLCHLLKEANHEVKYYPTPQMRKADELFSDLSDFNPDIVHLHCFYNTFPYSILPELTSQYNVVYTLHDVYSVSSGWLECWNCSDMTYCLNCPHISKRQRFNPWRNKTFRTRWYKRRMHKRARFHIVTPSLWMKNRIRKTELSKMPITHIPYGIDTDLFKPDPSARAKLGFNRDVKLLLFVGSNYGKTNPRKGLRFLLEAYSREIKRKFLNCVLLIVGREEELTHMEGVQFTGEVEHKDMPLYYAAADIHVLPTLADNLPYTVLESMACGTPVIASEIGGVPEEVIDGKTGFLVPVADPTAIAEAVLKLLKDDEMRAKMGNTAVGWIREKFSMERYLKAHLELYERIINERRD